MSSLLQDREKTHGPYTKTAEIAQTLKDAMRSAPNWDSLDDTQRESLHMIASKIARILSGNWDEVDHWRDICGYAKLIVHELDAVNAYIASECGPTPRPGAGSLETLSPAPASCVWPDEEEQPEK